LRVTLGVAALAHGLLKIFVFTLAGAAGFFESLGLPGFLAYMVTFAEVIGGVMLIAGFQTRAAALALIPVLLGATWAHGGNGWVFSKRGRRLGISAVLDLCAGCAGPAWLRRVCGG
jgi:putative oxidoreductase